MDELEPVTDLKTVHRYLKYGMELHEIVACYIEEADLRFDASLTSVDNARLLLELEISKESFSLLTTNDLSFIDRPQNPIRISFSVNEASFFAFTKFQFRQAKRIAVIAEMPIYKLQRREALRIKTMLAHQASLKLGDRIIPIFDISAGGLSILVSLKEQDAYQKGKLFANAVMAFGGKDFKVNLEVKNVLEHSKDGQQWKVGLGFKALPAAVEQMIAREAYLQTHKIWSRWL